MVVNKASFRRHVEQEEIDSLFITASAAVAVMETEPEDNIGERQKVTQQCRANVRKVRIWGACT